MKKKLTPILALILVVIASFFGVFPEGEVVETYPEVTITAEQLWEIGDDSGSADDTDEAVPEDMQSAIDPNGYYTSKEDVALYIHTYGCLPANFMTKAEARELGWEGGGLEEYAPCMCIGGDRFGNYEGLLPEDREYTECDIDTMGKDSRGAKRIVFSDDGLIYYTEDHYESFELLYGEP